ncbi:MAG TPA: LPS export ABC transporter periplasmic protein LptC [Fluviicoccus sp.]|nr:LPS export ABC transporter periplasmic protein LptC [Fluviicoccus sp.]
MDIRNVVSLSGGLLLLGAVGYFWGGIGKSPLAASSAVARGLPDYEVTGIRGIRTDEFGRVADTLSARTLRHYPDSDRGEIEAPVLQYFRDGSLRWQLTADRAETFRDNREIRLSGNVRAGTLGAEPVISLTTSMLTADRDAQTLGTGQPVLVRSGQSTLGSQGLHVDIRRGILELPAQVRGNYVLPSR